MLNILNIFASLANFPPPIIWQLACMQADMTFARTESDNIFPGADLYFKSL